MGFNDELRDRTKDFALRVIKLFRSLPKTEEARIIGQSVRISEQQQEQGQKQNFIPSFLLLSKKQMNPHFGWNC